MTGSAMRNTAKIRDTVSGAPLVALFALGIAGLVPHLKSEWAILARAFAVVPALQILSQTATIAFMLLQTVLFVIRRMPERKASGVLPRAVALVGSNFGFAFFLVPRTEQSEPLLIFSTVLVTVGLLFSIYAAANLGRSFGILPQARGLVQDGPYRWVRHPLYLAEQITTFGIMGQFRQPWALAIALATLALQIGRMHFEEALLAETYPGYRAYMARTARLLPGIY
jgi:protein-S-isoprenylcysteine O-methyltransferase Ste14